MSGISILSSRIATSERPSKERFTDPKCSPANATTEDLIVKFLAGLDEQVQTGVVIFNLYVPDIPHADGRMVPDKNRIGKLEELLLAFVETAGGTEYWLETDTTPTTMRNEEIEQHFIYARIKFNRITE